MSDLIYRPWYFERPAPAQRWIDQLMDGSGDPIALFGPRRVGKTSYLLNELSAAARARKLLPVYVDIWQNRADAFSAINYALREALDDLAVPASTAGRRLKTPVKRIGIVGASIDLGDEPSRQAPAEPALLVDWLLKSLVRAAGRPILLLFDEIQELATAPSGETVVSALRSALTKQSGRVRAVFTGSSQEPLLELFSRSRAALYEGASLVPFPLLGLDFLEFVTARAKQRFRKPVAVPALASAFERLHYQPRALIDLVLVYCTSDFESLDAALDRQWAELLDSGHWETVWKTLKPLQRAICRRVALGLDISSSAARAEYARGRGSSDISPGSVSSAVAQLLKSHVLARASTARGAYMVEDPLLAEWIRRRTS